MSAYANKQASEREREGERERGVQIFLLMFFLLRLEKDFLIFKLYIFNPALEVNGD